MALLRLRLLPGCVAQRDDLRAAGITPRQIEAGVRAGDLRRLRRGWYGTPLTPPDVARAVTLGGALTCVSALAMQQVWVPTASGLHVRRAERFRSAPLPEGVRECYASREDRVVAAVDEARPAWRAALRCVSSEEALAITDSAMRRGLVDRSDIAALPALARHRLRHVDPRSESGTETLVRVRLTALGVKVTPQVVIPRVGRVDLLVGEGLVIECDSRAHHTDLAAYRNDRRRDRELALGGYERVRLTWEDVTFRWDEVVRVILALVRRDAHRRRSQRRRMPHVEG